MLCDHLPDGKHSTMLTPPVSVKNTKSGHLNRQTDPWKRPLVQSISSSVSSGGERSGHSEIKDLKNKKVLYGETCKELYEVWSEQVKTKAVKAPIYILWHYSACSYQLERAAVRMH